MYNLFYFAHGKIANDILGAASRKLQNSVEFLEPVKRKFKKPLQTRSQRDMAAENGQLVWLMVVLIASRSKIYVCKCLRGMTRC